MEQNETYRSRQFSQPNPSPVHTQKLYILPEPSSSNLNKAREKEMPRWLTDRVNRALWRVDAAWVKITKYRYQQTHLREMHFNISICVRQKPRLRFLVFIASWQKYAFIRSKPIGTKIQVHVPKWQSSRWFNMLHSTLLSAAMKHLTALALLIPEFRLQVCVQSAELYSVIDRSISRPAKVSKEQAKTWSPPSQTRRWLHRIKTLAWFRSPGNRFIMIQRQNYGIST